jgi:hypothetical protein
MSPRTRAASPVGWVALVTVAALVVIFYIVPLLIIAWEADFTAIPRLSPKLAGALADSKELSTLLRSIIVPVLVGLSAAAVDRLLTLKTILFIALLVIGLLAALTALLQLNDSQALNNWKMHGLTPEFFTLLMQFARQSVESMLSFLALLAGIAIPKETSARRRG